MANTLDDLMPQILARALVTLRSRLVMPGLVNTDYKADAAKKGQTVDVPLPPVVEARDVTPGATPQASDDIVGDSVPIQLTNWKEAAIHLTDREQLEVIDDTVIMAVDAAAYALARAVNASIFSQYKGVYGYTGTAGTTPFATTYAVATAARKVLNNQNAPLEDRRMVVSPDAEENAINLSAFADAGFTSQNGVILEGNIGRKLGFDWFMDQQVPTHTAGTITTGLIAKAATAQAIGDKTIVCTTAASTGACALKEGDIVSFAGDDQTYVLTADATQASASSDVTLNIEPGLKVALTGSQAVTVRSTHEVNLAFNRGAIALAVRPLGQSQAGGRMMTMVDQVTGLPLRLEVSRQHKQDNWSLDILWGTKLVRPDLACRVAG